MPKTKYWCFRSDCPIVEQYTHDLRFKTPLACLHEIKARAFREWGWPLGSHFVLNATDYLGTRTVLAGVLTPNGKILFED